MPSLQQIYYCTTQISSHSYTVDALTKELDEELRSPNGRTKEIVPLGFDTAIHIENLSFSYPHSKAETLCGVNLTIRQGNA